MLVGYFFRMCNHIFGHILGTDLIGGIAFEIGLAVVADPQRI